MCPDKGLDWVFYFAKIIIFYQKLLPMQRIRAAGPTKMLRLNSSPDIRHNAYGSAATGIQFKCIPTI